MRWERNDRTSSAAASHRCLPSQPWSCWRKRAPTVDKPSPDPHLLNFLREGQTKREDIALRFGPPSRTLEQERVLFYRLGQNQKGYFIREARYENWAEVRHSLVLVLDEQGVLQKHSLVPVR